MNESYVKRFQIFSNKNSSLEYQPICISKRPAGTTWIFSDGSQVLASPCKSEISDDDKHAFFDEFERQTHGENFSLGAVIAADAEAERMRLVKEKQQSERNELDDFFDEFEKTTQGENFKRKESHNGDT